MQSDGSARWPVACWPSLRWRPPARAEVIELVDKTKMNGKIIHYYDGVYTVEANGQTMKLPREKIRSISFQLPPARAEFSTPEKTFERWRKALTEARPRRPSTATRSCTRGCWPTQMGLGRGQGRHQEDAEGDRGDQVPDQGIDDQGRDRHLEGPSPEGRRERHRRDRLRPRERRVEDAPAAIGIAPTSWRPPPRPVRLGASLGVGGGGARGRRWIRSARAGATWAGSRSRSVPATIAQSSTAPANRAPAPPAPAAQPGPPRPRRRAASATRTARARTSASPTSASRSSCARTSPTSTTARGRSPRFLGLYWSHKGANGLPGGGAALLALLVAHHRHADLRAVLLAVRGPRQAKRRHLVRPHRQRPPRRARARSASFRSSTPRARCGWAVPFLGTLAVQESHDRRAPSARRPTSTGGGARRRARPTSGSRSSSRPARRTHAFTFALPLNFYWRHEDDANLLALPLFYYNSHKTGYRLLTWLGYTHRQGRSTAARWPGSTGGAATRRPSRATTSSSRSSGTSRRRRTARRSSSRWSGAFAARASNVTVVGPVRPRPRGDLVLQRASRRCGGPAATTRPGAPTGCWSPSSTGIAREHGLASHLVTPLGGYSRDDRDGTRTWVALALPLVRASRSGRRANDAHPALSQPRGSQRRFDGARHRSALLPADRSARVDHHPVPALLALLGRGDRRQRDGALPAVRAPLRPARLEHPRRSGLLAPLHERRLERRPLPHRLLRAERRARPRGRLPALLALLHRSVVDDRPVPALLRAPGPARLRRRGDAAVLLRPPRRRELRGAVPALLPHGQRAPRDQRHHHAARVRRARSGRDQRGRRPHHPPRLLALRPRPLALRAAAALLVLRRPRGRQDRRPSSGLTGTGAGAARRPTGSSRCSTTGAAPSPAAATRPA